MDEWVLTACTSLFTVTFIDYVSSWMMNVVITTLIQYKQGSSKALIMEKQKKGWGCYSNIGGIIQPTYFSKLTHCSLNWEVEKMYCLKQELKENLKYNKPQYCLSTANDGWPLLERKSTAHQVLYIKASFTAYDFINRKPNKCSPFAIYHLIPSLWICCNQYAIIL